MWRFLYFTSQTKHALENSFPSMKNVSSLRAIFSSHMHVDLSHHSISAHDWRRIDKPLKTHPPPATGIMCLITAQLCHSVLTLRGGKGGVKTRTEPGARRETGTGKVRLCSLIQKCGAQSDGLTRPPRLVVELLYCLHSIFFKNLGFDWVFLLHFFINKSSTLVRVSGWPFKQVFGKPIENFHRGL